MNWNTSSWLIGGCAAAGLFFNSAAEAQSDTLDVSRPYPSLVSAGSDRLEERAGTKIESITEYLNAVKAIASKAAQLGWTGAAISDVDYAHGGYFHSFAEGDIYFSSATGAHEIHGEILRKFDIANPELGLPTTDEQGTPDGIGRYNHFTNGSIYWTPRTGPMIVRGTVRDRWAASGWERGPLGYPVEDQHRMALRGPTPVVEWCRFEHGLIAGDARGALPVPVALQTAAESLGLEAPPALLTYAELGALFGARLNQQFIASPDNVALHSGMELTGVSNWKYGFFASTPRSVGFRFRGFHDNGLATDTDFVIDIRLRFELVWNPSDTEPTNKTLVAALEDLTVRGDGGLPLAAVYAGVNSAIIHAFYTEDVNLPNDPAHPEVPSGAIFVADVPTGANIDTGMINVLDVMINAAGGLQILVNPLTPPTDQPGQVAWGYLRQLFAQNVLDSL